MQSGWIIYNEMDAEKNKSYIDWFIHEADLQNISLELILREELSIGIKDNKRAIYLKSNIVIPPDFAIIRTIEPLLNLHLESCGSVVFNSSTVSRICNNKALTHHHITDLGIPMVDTLFVAKEHIQKAAPPMSYPFVVKEIAGKGGKQVYFIKNSQDWKRCISLISTDAIVQACHVKQGKDIRVFVIGKQIIGAVLRESRNDFRANFTLGGEARLYELNDTEKSTVEKIISHFNFDMVGIDFLIGLDGNLLFNEIEDVVGSRTLSTLSDINLLQKYVTHIKQVLSGL